jgi:malonyl-CoA/methylmalonyl-CoA synthetase
MLLRIRPQDIRFMHPILDRAARRPAAPALLHAGGVSTYGELARRSQALAGLLLDGRGDLAGARVAILAAPGPGFVAALWGAWLAGGVAVPLGLAATAAEIDRSLEDSGASWLVADAERHGALQAACQTRGVRLLDPAVTAAATGAATGALPDVDPDRPALILFTSGTTSRPKAALSTHAGVRAWIESLVAAWRWSADDRIPLFLPLHHIHGLINVLSCALWSGAVVDLLDRFEADTVIGRVEADAYTVFMAVPTIYVKLIERLRTLPEAERSRAAAGFGRLRLMVSGSAALPASVFNSWEALTGQRLLERYGMTEIGMALSNPYDGERRPGTVGSPLPGVEVRLVAEDGAAARPGEPGEIQVRGSNVFREYRGLPEATAATFVDGWFRTGDVAVVEDGYYRILGRTSTDIIKSGGYKLSALEIESVLLDHPDVAECAVVGVPDETWGEAVAAVVVARVERTLDEDSLRQFCRERLSPYKLPRRWLAVGGLPRNAMGKVVKPEVAKLFAPARSPVAPLAGEGR